LIIRAEDPPPHDLERNQDYIDRVGRRIPPEQSARLTAKTEQPLKTTPLQQPWSLRQLAGMKAEGSAYADLHRLHTAAVLIHPALLLGAS
jgi:hypothetical protein